MYDIERRNKILEILRNQKSCSVRELAKKLMFSEATIRRDLNALDKEPKKQHRSQQCCFSGRGRRILPLSRQTCSPTESLRLSVPAFAPLAYQTVHRTV